MSRRSFDDPWEETPEDREYLARRRRESDTEMEADAARWGIDTRGFGTDNMSQLRLSMQIIRAERAAGEGPFHYLRGTGVYARGGFGGGGRFAGERGFGGMSGRYGQLGGISGRDGERGGMSSESIGFRGMSMSDSVFGGVSGRSRGLGGMSGRGGGLVRGRGAFGGTFVRESRYEPPSGRGSGFGSGAMARHRGGFGGMSGRGGGL